MAVTDEDERALRAGAMIRAAAAQVSAPAALLARVEDAHRAAWGVEPRRRRFRVAATGIAVACAAAFVALLVAPPGGAPAGPSVAQAARLGALSPQSGAPGPGRPGLLDAEQDGVPFPDLRRSFGWHATGRRVDDLEGRPATTVFYAKGDRSLAYTIVGGTALAQPPGRLAQGGGATTVRLLTAGGRDMVTWRRRGRTCIVVARGVPRAALVRLASWRGEGAVPF